VRVDRSFENFKNVFSQVVTEETYSQSLSSEYIQAKMKRELRSDLLLFWPPTLESWVEFRDVYEVDGKAVRDRQDRLEKLFLQPCEMALAQARQITDESARYNIGDIRRDFNIPTFAFHVLNPTVRQRFKIKKVTEEVVQGIGTWMVRLDEKERPTLIRNRDDDRDIPSVVTLWIDPESGSILKTQITVCDVHADRQARITVLFRLDSRLGIWTPAEMYEIYDHPQQKISARFYRKPDSSFTVLGRATYSNFRQLEVETEVQLKDVDRPGS